MNFIKHSCIDRFVHSFYDLIRLPIPFDFVSFVESRGADHTFAWLEEELYAVNDVVSFAEKRLEGAADVLEQEFYR